MASIEKGTVFGGRYVVQSPVGTGGMATVYRGIDNVLDRAVAIKVMLPQYANDPAFAQRFKQEAQAAAALQNPYIVSVYDWGRDETTGTYYIVMEYLRGTDLKTGIRSHGALAPRKVAQIGAQVCSALAVAHAHDIIHRDIKPQNIMIQPNGDAKVMDFGIARAKNSHLTQTNSVLGTAHYVSPEQAQGKELDATSDLYSLGIVMYEAATGKLPFDGDDAVTVALKQVNEYAVPPSKVNPNVDEGLEAIIMRCMSKDPRQRFQSADELRHVLNNYINGRPLGIPAPGNAPATRLLTPAAATQTLRPGATGTQRMGREPDRMGGTQRMATPGYATTRGMNGMNGVNGMNGRSTSGMRGGSGGRGGSGSRGGSRRREPARGPVIGIVIVVAIALILVAVLALTSCNSCSNPTPAPSGTSANTTNNQTSATAGEKVAVPDLANYTQQEAKNKLESVGLQLGSVTEEKSTAVITGKVIRTTPAAKTEVAAGTAVNLVISSGSETVAVPDLRGHTVEEATQLLTQAGLVGEYDQGLDAFHATYPAGTVVTYTPANKAVAKGTTIKYGLSQGVDPATIKSTVPDVTNWWYEDAFNTVVASNLTYTEVWEYNSDFAWGHVISTDPIAGTQLDRNATITVRVSQGVEQVEIGAYYGWSGESAQTALTNLGLTSSIDSTTPAPDAASAGLVYATDPRSGTMVTKGSSVIVYVYGAYVPPTGYLPTDTAGSSVDAVIGQLRGAGFSSFYVTDRTIGIGEGDYGNYTVESIEGAGNSVPLSDTITIYVQAIAQPEPPTDGGAA